jgi:hypothetical protein
MRDMLKKIRRISNRSRTRMRIRISGRILGNSTVKFGKKFSAYIFFLNSSPKPISAWCFFCPSGWIFRFPAHSFWVSRSLTLPKSGCSTPDFISPSARHCSSPDRHCCSSPDCHCCKLQQWQSGELQQWRSGELQCRAEGEMKSGVLSSVVTRNYSELIVRSSNCYVFNYIDFSFLYLFYKFIHIFLNF